MFFRIRAHMIVLGLILRFVVVSRFLKITSICAINMDPLELDLTFRVVRDGENKYIYRFFTFNFLISPYFGASA